MYRAILSSLNFSIEKKWPGDEASESVGVRVVVVVKCVNVWVCEGVGCVRVLSTRARTCTHTGQQYAPWAE